MNMLAPDGQSRVVLIDYSQEGHPFSVLTLDPAGNYDQYDFEYCRRDETLYYNLSGGGHGLPRYHLSRTMEGGRAVWSTVWMERESVRVLVPYCRWWRGRRARWGHRPPIFGALDWWRHRIRRLTGPLGNPFEGAEEGHTTHCAACDDWLPTDYDDRPCGHLEWSDDAGEFVGPGSDDLGPSRGER